MMIDTETPILDIEADDEDRDPEAVQEFDIFANIQAENLATDIEDEELTRLGRKVVEEYEIDAQSRKDAGWDEKNDQAVKLAMQVAEVKTYPWPNAANVKYPLVTVAAIQFAARAYPAIVDGFSVVRGKVLGEPTDEKRERADRIGAHMSWQLLEEMKEWEADTDRLLHMLPVVGCMFRKTWFDPVRGRNCSELLPPEKVVVDYFAKADCPRWTEVKEYYPHQITERFRAELWREIEYQTGNVDDDAPEVFLEQHRLWDMDGDGYPEPYIVTVHKDTGRVVRIVARYDVDGVTVKNGKVVRIEPVNYFTKYSFIPSLDGSYYDIGFGSLLSALNETINATINQLLDAGHLSNMQGGFIGSGVTMKSGVASFKPGEWKKVSTDAGDLKSQIVPMPVREPSSVLFQLLGMMVEAARDITATKDILTGETQGSNQAVGTTLAMIEQGLKVFTAIYKRIHRSLKHELGCLYRLNRLYLDPQVYFEFQDKQGQVALDDYRDDDMDVIPVSDPTIVSDMQRIGRAQFLMQFLGKGLDDKAIITRVLEAASIPDVKELFPEGPPPPNPDAIKAEAEAKAKGRELDIKEATAKADIAAKQAGAEETTLRTILAAPALFEGIAALVQRAMQEAMNVGPQGMGGMAEPALDQGVPGLPQGGAGPVGPEMGGGGMPVPGGPDQGQDIGGVGGPEMV